MPLEPAVPRHRLRVAVACSGLGHVARGIEARAADLARALRQHPGDVDVALFSGASFPDVRAIGCWRRGGAVAPRLSGLARYLGGWRFGRRSDYEVGIVLLQAVSAGLPVICHDAPAFRIVAGPVGLFRDLSAEGGIADAITALRDPELRADLAARARPHVEARFSAAAVAPQVVSMYRTIAARRKASA